MAQELQGISSKHREIIRMAFLGVNNTDIAAAVGFTPPTVSHILRSPLAQAELERLHSKAEESITNVPLRVSLLRELNEASRDAVSINGAIMRDSQVDPRIRSRIGFHFMDRHLFGKDPDEKEGSWREILRRLDQVQKQIEDSVGTSTQPVVSVEVNVNGGNGNGNGSAPGEIDITPAP